MSGNHDERDDLLTQERVLDALLEEHLGDHTPPDLTAVVLAAHARGDAVAAAQQLHEATQPANAPSRRWLAAAALLLGVLAVASALLWRERPAQVPIDAPQDPQPRTVVPVHGLDELRTLLPQVTAIQLAVYRIYYSRYILPVDAVPVHFTPPEADLATTFADARVVEPAGWDWPNCFDLQLRDGRTVALAIDTPATGERLRVGLRGLQGDLSVGGPGAAKLREMLESAEHAARVAGGITRSVKELASMPPGTEALRLFGIVGQDLQQLARFPALRRLDLSGLRASLTPEELATVGHLDSLCESLRELRLDGCRFGDLGIISILPLVHLQRLELRGVVPGPGRNNTPVTPFTGTGFLDYTNSSLRRDGPIAVDLADCPLTDDGLAAIAQWSLRELHLDGSGGTITAAGWRSLMSCRDVHDLDLSRWPLDAARLEDLAARKDLEVLALRDCKLDDAALQTLAATRSQLQKLDVSGNPALTAPALAALRAQLPQTTILPAK